MRPVGHTIRLWRLERGLTQVEVSQKSGISRPNLSAIEQGARDLTLQTLRRIAVVLDVSPGTLANGMGPDTALLREDKYSLDRIAHLAVGRSVRATSREKEVAKELASLIESKTNPIKQLTDLGSKSNLVLKLKFKIGQKVFKHLIQRIDKISVHAHE